MNFSTCKVFVCFCLFRATPAAYGGSQARARIRVVALAYTTATASWDPSLSYLPEVTQLEMAEWNFRPYSDPTACALCCYTVTPLQAVSPLILCPPRLPWELASHLPSTGQMCPLEDVKIHITGQGQLLVSINA